MAITFRQLEVFQAVAEVKSFTRASQRLLVSQSTVSEHIRQLEETLMTQVFDRGQRKITLTAAGERLFDFSRKIFHLLEEAELAARYAPDEFAGRLVVGCASTTLLYRLSPVLKEFVKKYPNVELLVKSYRRIQPLVSDLRSGATELAMVVLPVSGPDLRKTTLVEEPFYAVVPRGHRLANKKRFNMESARDEPFILYHPVTNTRKLIDQFFHKVGFVPRVVMQLEDTEAIKELVAGGFGLSLLPESAFLVHGRSEEVKAFPLNNSQLKRRIGLISMRSRSLRPAAEAFGELLISQPSPRQSID